MLFHPSLIRHTPLLHQHLPGQHEEYEDSDIRQSCEERGRKVGMGGEEYCVRPLTNTHSSGLQAGRPGSRLGVSGLGPSHSCGWQAAPVDTEGASGDKVGAKGGATLLVKSVQAPACDGAQVRSLTWSVRT